MRKPIKPIKPKVSIDANLFKEIRALIMAARNAVIRNINTVQVMTSFEIGRMIMEHEQQGENRAEYGKALLKVLSNNLTEEFGRGFSRSNLQNMRDFYMAYCNRLPEKCQMPSGKLTGERKSRTPSDKIRNDRKKRIIDAVSNPMTHSGK